MQEKNMKQVERKTHAEAKAQIFLQFSMRYHFNFFLRLMTLFSTCIRPNRFNRKVRCKKPWQAEFIHDWTVKKTETDVLNNVKPLNTLYPSRFYLAHVHVYIMIKTSTSSLHRFANIRAKVKRSQENPLHSVYIHLIHLNVLCTLYI